MDQQDKIYLWLALITTAGFTTALVFAIFKALDYADPVATGVPLF